MRGKARWAIFVHDPDGDMGYGEIVGAFNDAEKAEAKQAAIERAAEKDGVNIECLVLPLRPGGTSAAWVAKAVR